MRFLYIFAAFIMLAVSLATLPLDSAAEERLKLRGRYVGLVAGFAEDKRLVMVDIGSAHGVFRGMDFAVVDDTGSQVATVRAGEVFDDLFWSDEVEIREFRSVRYGMQVRWLFTPESSALLRACDVGTPEAYAGFFTAYPKGRLALELAISLGPDMRAALDPEYAAAWDEYTAEAFDAYAHSHMDTALGRAAERESASIKEYARSRKEDRKNNKVPSAKTPAGSEKNQDDRPGGAPDDPFNQRYDGRIVNNSTVEATFEFDPPATLGRISVPAFGSVDVQHGEGSFTFRVYLPEDGFGTPDMDFGDMQTDLPGFDDPGMDIQGFDDPPATRVPAMTGTVDINFDMWEVIYP